MTPTTRPHEPSITSGWATAAHGPSVVETATGAVSSWPVLEPWSYSAGAGRRPGGVSIALHRAPATARSGVRAVLVGACLMVLLTGCSLDVDTFRENIETHWAGVERTSPAPSPPASPTPGPSDSTVVNPPPASGGVKGTAVRGLCPQGEGGACRI
jgi:hypothetical protein